MQSEVQQYYNRLGAIWADEPVLKPEAGVKPRVMIGLDYRLSDAGVDFFDAVADGAHGVLGVFDAAGHDEPTSRIALSLDIDPDAPNARDLALSHGNRFIDRLKADLDTMDEKFIASLIVEDYVPVDLESAKAVHSGGPGIHRFDY